MHTDSLKCNSSLIPVFLIILLISILCEHTYWELEPTDLENAIHLVFCSFRLRFIFIYFQIQPDDNLPIGICRICWKLVNEFHELYKSVEIVHKRCCVDENVKCNNDLKNDEVSNDFGSVNFTIVEDDENDIHIYDDNDTDADNDGDGNNDDLFIKSEYTDTIDNETYKNENSQMVESSVQIKLENIDVTSDTTSTNSKKTHKIETKLTRNRNGISFSYTIHDIKLICVFFLS